MFSQEVLKDFKTFMKLAAFFFAVPFDWNEEKKGLKLSQRPVRYFGWIFFQVLQIVYTLNVWSSLYNGIFMEESELDPARIAIDLLISVGMTFMIILDVPLVKNIYTFPEFVWQVFNLQNKKETEILMSNSFAYFIF